MSDGTESASDLPESATILPVPATIIVVHPKERRSKCTVAPLRGRADFCFWNYPNRGPEPLDEFVRLGFGGPIIGPADARNGLLILDGSWRWATVMEAEYRSLPVRSLPAIRTAYPRVSKTFADPEEGLASIEAVYAAYKLMGRDVTGLLESYHWADEFLQMNAVIR